MGNFGEVGKDVTKNTECTDESNSSGDEDQLENPHEESNHAPKRHCPFPSSETPGPSKKPCRSTTGDCEQLVNSQEESNSAREHQYPSSNVAIPDLLSASGGSVGPSVVEGPGGSSGVEDLRHAFQERPNPVDNHGLDDYSGRSANGDSGGPSVVACPGVPSGVEELGGLSGVEDLCHASPERPNPVENHGLDDYNGREMRDNEIVNVFNGGQIDIAVDDEPLDHQPVGRLPQEGYEAAAPNAFVEFNGHLYGLIRPLPQEGYDAAAPIAFVEFNGHIYGVIGPLPQEGYEAAAPNAFVEFNGHFYGLIRPLPQEGYDAAAPIAFVEFNGHLYGLIYRLVPPLQQVNELQDLEVSSSSDSGFEDLEQEFYNVFE